MPSFDPRRLSPWWALLLLPAALPIPWIVASLPRPERASVDRWGESLLAPSATRATTVEPSPIPALLADSLAESSAADADTVPDPAVYSSWTTYEDAVRQSGGEGKAVLLSFNADWSEPGRLLKHEVFDDAAAGITVRAAVIPVAIFDRVREDGENTPEIAELERRFTVEVFPTLVVFSPATGHTRRLQGYTSSAETLRWIIEAATAVR